MSVLDSLRRPEPGHFEAGASIEDSPVDCFDRGVEQFRSTVRERLPFTFIAYRSLIPAKDDDWYYLAEKVAWFVFVMFNFVDFAIKTVSVFFIALPFVPMILDAVWIASRSIKLFGKSLPSVSVAWQKSIQAIGLVAFSVIGIVCLFQKVKPY